MSELAAPLVDVIIEDERWNDLGLDALAEQAARQTLVHLGLSADSYEIALLACNDARIAELNAEFREKPVATNVLSWPAWELASSGDGAPPLPPPEAAPEDPESLGDIAIAYETCLQEATEQHKSAADHVSHLIVHAILHLLGHDHIRDMDAALMEETETCILANMGVADPYAERVHMPD